MQQVRDNKKDRIKHVTSIGNSSRSTPKNKHKEEVGNDIEDKGKDDNGNLHKGTFYTY